jgi:membrane protein DedA with SNARE-associated domain
MDLASFSSFLIRLIQVHGPWIISVVVALESAGVPLPGETILVAAALLAAATDQIDIVVVVAAAAAGAIIGDGIGYTVGRCFGMPLLRKYGRYIRLDENRLLIGRYLFFRYGSAVVFFGRFIAVLRIFAALLAAQMACRRDAFSSLTSRGHLLGVSLRLRCPRCRKRNLQDFGNAEPGVAGIVYWRGICAFNHRAAI